MKEKLKGKFKYVVLFVILFIPFIYSFFYLKAYWNPYGKGNIDNLPVAIVNLDTGDKGNALINGIKDSKKLKLSVISEEEADNGLSDGTYYAVIKVPKTFTSDMESASTNNKKHATITYSPNQKSNYLASQIINNVVLNVEKNLDNEVNSKIVEGLTDSLKEVPTSLDTINNGFEKLSDGTNKLKNGSSKIVSGSSFLASNYLEFNNGVNNINNGTGSLYSGARDLDNGLGTLQSSLNNMDLSGLDTLKNGVSSLNDGETEFNRGLQSYLSLVSYAMNHQEYLNYTTSVLHSYNEDIPSTSLTLAQYIDYVGSSSNNDLSLSKASTNVASGISQLNESINGESSQISDLKTNLLKLQAGVNDLKDGSSKLVNGANTLNTGVNKLSVGSNKILSGINTLNNANSTLNGGINTLNNSVNNAKKELSSKTDVTKDDIKKIETLSEYSNKPINVETKEVNKVSTYGTAFTPLFVSVGLWVGCLMMFMVLYYDKEERYGIFGINDKRLVKQMLSYHSLITLSSVVLAILLDTLLRFNITNYLLYYGSFILISNTFMAIVLFLITNFKDIGKFIALILLVLGLTSSAGTFPVDIVTKGFRWLNPYLPMTYSIKLLKECILKIDSNILNKSLVTLSIIFIIFFIINTIINIRNEKKAN